MIFEAQSILHTLHCNLCDVLCICTGQMTWQQAHAQMYGFRWIHLPPHMQAMLHMHAVMLKRSTSL